MAILYADRCDRRKSQSRAHPAISAGRRDLRIKSLIVSFFRRQEVNMSDCSSVERAEMLT